MCCKKNEMNICQHSFIADFYLHLTSNYYLETHSRKIKWIKKNGTKRKCFELFIKEKCRKIPFNIKQLLNFSLYRKNKQNNKIHKRKWWRWREKKVSKSRIKHSNNNATRSLILFVQLAPFKDFCFCLNLQNQRAWRQHCCKLIT